MRHGYMYNGAFELNFPDLHPGTTTYKTTDGTERPLPPWPDTVDGIRIAYMEKTGKKFFAVRVQHDQQDIDPMRHMNNRRFTAQPTLVNDDEASTLLDDIIRENPDKQTELALMINRINQIRRASRTRSAS
jgi:hypothetical protein